eukprot:329629-Pyramimonas_sp.AAC.1
MAQVQVPEPLAAANPTTAPTEYLRRRSARGGGTARPPLPSNRTRPSGRAEPRRPPPAIPTTIPTAGRPSRRSAGRRARGDEEEPMAEMKRNQRWRDEEEPTVER